MHRAISRKRLWFSALFVAGALAIGATGVFVVASRQWRVQPTFLRPPRSSRRSAGSTRADPTLRVQGIDAGVVERIEAPAAPGGLVTLWFRIERSGCTT